MFNQFNQVMAILECFFAKADKHCNIIFVFNYIICVFSSSNLFGLCQHVIGTLAFFLQLTSQLIASVLGQNRFCDTFHAFVGQITAVLLGGGVKVAWRNARSHMQKSGLAKSLVQITQQQYNATCMNH